MIRFPFCGHPEGVFWVSKGDHSLSYEEKS